MATSVATPLERQFGRIASVTEMTSSSSLGNTGITLQFDLNRNIDAAARDVQAAINAARSNLPADLPSQPTYRKVNPADAPIVIIAMTSDVYTKGRMYDVADSILAQKISQVPGVGQVFVGGGASPAVRVEVNPAALNDRGIALSTRRHGFAVRQRQPGQGGSRKTIIGPNRSTPPISSFSPRITRNSLWRFPTAIRFDCRMSPMSRIPSPMCAPRGLPTANRRSSSSFSASPTRTSSTPSIACGR